MVKESKGFIRGVECLWITEVVNPRVIHNSLDEDLDAALSSLVNLEVLNQGSPGGFGTDAVNARSFSIDCRVIAGRTGGWVYEGSAVVVKIPICAGNESPKVVDAIDMVAGGLEKDRQDCIGERDKIVVGGLSINGGEERLGCCKG